MEDSSLVGGGLCVVLGLLIIIARSRRWRWFNDHIKVERVEVNLGDKGTNTFYYIQGSIAIIIGILVMLKIIG